MSALPNRIDEPPAPPAADKWPTDSRVAELYSEHRDKVLGYLIAQRISKELAEEILQDSIKMVMLRCRGQGFVEGNPKAYWYMAAQRRMWRVLKSEQKQKQVQLEIQNRPDPADDGGFVVLGGYQWASDVVRRLPAKQARVLWLRVIEDVSEADAAKILKVSRGTMKSQLSDAKRNLEKILNDELSKREGEI